MGGGEVYISLPVETFGVIRKQAEQPGEISSRPIATMSEILYQVDSDATAIYLIGKGVLDAISQRYPSAQVAQMVPLGFQECIRMGSFLLVL